MEKLYSPSIIAVIYLSLAHQKVTENKLMKVVNDISEKLENIGVNFDLSNTRSYPGFLHWNAGVCSSLARLSKLEIVKSKRTEKNLFFRKGKNMRHYIENCKKIFPDEAKKIIKATEEYVSRTS